ncbi:MAG: class I SAM-dependent methyltransferase [Rhodospirillaceae bacterium]|nr:class I SAM-dependent methyltransferase [Rhodospirillaceae bacterium]
MNSLSTVRLGEASDLVVKVERALTAAVLQANLDPNVGIYSIDGMSGRKYRFFINALIRSLADARYLEVGTWRGSTLCSAVHGNKVRAVAIDNWSEFGGPKDVCMANLKRFMTPENSVHVIEGDFRAVDYRDIGTFNVYLFDGPHEEKDQYDGLAMALPAVDKEFVFVVDDWNWDKVRSGTFAAIEKCGLKVRFASEIRTDLPEPHKFEHAGRHTDWHNGYFISVLEKA